MHERAGRIRLRHGPTFRPNVLVLQAHRLDWERAIDTEYVPKRHAKGMQIKKKCEATRYDFRVEKMWTTGCHNDCQSSQGLPGSAPIDARTSISSSKHKKTITNGLPHSRQLAEFFADEFDPDVDLMCSCDCSTNFQKPCLPGRAPSERVRCYKAREWQLVGRTRPIHDSVHLVWPNDGRWRSGTNLNKTRTKRRP